jgi:hypothetical protein
VGLVKLLLRRMRMRIRLRIWSARMTMNYEAHWHFLDLSRPARGYCIIIYKHYLPNDYLLYINPSNYISLNRDLPYSLSIFPPITRHVVHSPCNLHHPRPPWSSELSGSEYQLRRFISHYSQ